MIFLKNRPKIKPVAQNISRPNKSCQWHCTWLLVWNKSSHKKIWLWNNRVSQKNKNTMWTYPSFHMSLIIWNCQKNLNLQSRCSCECVLITESSAIYFSIAEEILSEKNSWQNWNVFQLPSYHDICACHVGQSAPNSQVKNHMEMIMLTENFAPEVQSKWAYFNKSVFIALNILKINTFPKVDGQEKSALDAFQNHVDLIHASHHLYDTHRRVSA